MSEGITAILLKYRDDSARLSEHLIPVVYERMKALARRRMASERRAVTFDPTSLTHEAFLRLVRSGGPWKSSAHFLGAVSEAMRRILVEHARSRKRIRHGGLLKRADSDPDELEGGHLDLDLIALGDALDRLQLAAPRKALVVKLRYFLGMSIPEVAEVVDVSVATVKLDWAFSKAFLHRELSSGGSLDTIDHA